MIKKLNTKKDIDFKFCKQTRNNVLYYHVIFYENPFKSYLEISKNDHGLLSRFIL